MPDDREPAFITGISGQDGSYLAEHLTARVYGPTLMLATLTGAAAPVSGITSTAPRRRR